MLNRCIGKNKKISTSRQSSQVDSKNSGASYKDKDKFPLILFALSLDKSLFGQIPARFEDLFNPFAAFDDSIPFKNVHGDGLFELGEIVQLKGPILFDLLLSDNEIEKHSIGALIKNSAGHYGLTFGYEIPYDWEERKLSVEKYENDKMFFTESGRRYIPRNDDSDIKMAGIILSIKTIKIILNKLAESQNAASMQGLSILCEEDDSPDLEGAKLWNSSSILIRESRGEIIGSARTDKNQNLTDQKAIKLSSDENKNSVPLSFISIGNKIRYDKNSKKIFIENQGSWWELTARKGQKFQFLITNKDDPQYTRLRGRALYSDIEKIRSYLFKYAGEEIGTIIWNNVCCDESGGLMEIQNISYISSDHIRYENGIDVSGHNYNCHRKIEINRNSYDKNIYLVTIYNLDGPHPIWQDNLQMSTKQMVIKSNESGKIELIGYGKDKSNVTFSDYGMTVYHKQGKITKIIGHMLDRNIDIEYLS